MMANCRWNWCRAKTLTRRHLSSPIVLKLSLAIVVALAQVQRCLFNCMVKTVSSFFKKKKYIYILFYSYFFVLFYHKKVLLDKKHWMVAKMISIAKQWLTLALNVLIWA